MSIKSNSQESAWLEQRIKSSILEIAKKRGTMRDGEFENIGSDYLGQLVKISCESDVKKRITTEQMIDEVKAVYGAGHLTTTNLLGWCILLLAINTEWQDKAREEVKITFGRNSQILMGLQD